MFSRFFSMFLILFLVTNVSFTFFTGDVHAKQMTAQQKQDRKDARNFKSAQKRLSELKKYLENENLSGAKRSANYIHKYYGRLSDKFKNTSEAIEFKIEADALIAKFSQQEESVNSSRNNAFELINQKAAYGSSINPYKDLFYYLYAGKTGELDDYSFMEVEKLVALWEDFNTFGKNFNENFNVLIEQAPTYEHDHISVDVAVELLKKRKEYRDSFVTLICDQELNAMVQVLNDAVQELGSEGYMSRTWLEELYGDKAQESFETVLKVTSYYEWIGQETPDAVFSKIAEFKPRLRDLLVKMSKKNKWDNSAYPYSNSAMKKTAQAYGDSYSRNLTAVKAGMKSDNEWRINKNELGIPISRSGRGFVVFQKQGEPFKRGYDVLFTEKFNGNDYEEISGMTLGDVVFPMK